MYEASKIKKYVDLIYNLHHKYVEELKENEQLRPKVIEADNKLRIALELTAYSQEDMEKLKEALGKDSNYFLKYNESNSLFLGFAWKESDASQLREQIIQEKLQELLIKCESYENKSSEQQDENAE